MFISSEASNCLTDVIVGWPDWDRVLGWMSLVSVIIGLGLGDDVDVGVGAIHVQR